MLDYIGILFIVLILAGATILLKRNMLGKILAMFIVLFGFMVMIILWAIKK